MGCGSFILPSFLLWIFYNSTGPCSGMRGPGPLCAPALLDRSQYKNNTTTARVACVLPSIALDPTAEIRGLGFGLMQIDHSPDQFFRIFRRHVPVAALVNRKLQKC